MLCFSGAAALSDFRRDRLIQSLKGIDPSVSELRAEYFYLLDVESITTSTQERLCALLDSSGEIPLQDLNGFLVVPRLGTRSPWSSKATDILHNCGIKEVARVERGVRFKLTVERADHQPELLDVLHDKMTESILDNVADLKQVFAQTDPMPLSLIDVLNGGMQTLAQANEELGLALSDDELDYLVTNFTALGRNPSDVELMMFKF